MSCKNAIKAGEKLDTEEIRILLTKLHKIGKYTCPHGRPIIVKLPFIELDKKFGRK
jgi:DNA mismatch repair protein MutL